MREQIDCEIKQKKKIGVCLEQHHHIVLKKHNELENLDFEHAGHVGFAGIKQGTWEGSTYIPLKDEIIAYLVEDHIKLKVGDGTTAVNDLPFVGDEISAEIEEEIKRAQGAEESLNKQINNKVDKVEGKGLSTNDYTDEDKEKLGGISEGATKVEITDNTPNGKIKIDGVEKTVYDDTEVKESISDEVTRATEAEQTIDNKLDKTVLTGASIAVSGDTATITHNKVNLKSGATSSEQDIFPLADGSNAGLMAPSTVTAIQRMRSEIDALEGQTIRLLYTEKSNPTAAEILAFVQSRGYTDTSKYAGIAVVVQTTNHIWKWLSDEQVFNDFGLDTVNQFTNTQAGIIKGSEEDGQLYAEDDGTGSVVGWDDLKNRVTNAENELEKCAKTDEENTFSEAQTFEKGIIFGGSQLRKWRIISNADYVLRFFQPNGTELLHMNYTTIVPRNKVISLGALNNQWLDFYLSGKISDGTNEITVAQMVAKQDTLTFATDEEVEELFEE